MIGVDRPGYGLSDPHPKRHLADWPRDVEQLGEGRVQRNTVRPGKFRAGRPGVHDGRQHRRVAGVDFLDVSLADQAGA